jgi:dienelactone hydrolase
MNDRYILGGGWNDLPYMFNDAYTQSSFNRFITNGFRCIKYLTKEENLAELVRTIEPPFRDFKNEKPVSNEIFNSYLNQYAYDKGELNSIIESSDSTSDYWIKEKITFDAAYGNENMTVYLFLPKSSNPPYQMVVFFPGSNAIHERLSSLISTRSFDFIIKTGRAVLFPIYKSTYERGDDLNSDYSDETNFYKEHVIMWAKDLGRSIDYLESRSDINTNALAYYGLSWGAALGPIMMTVESRIKVGVLYVAGLGFQKCQPEVDPINFLPRLTIPVLMLNGKYDHFFPYETSQIPMFELIGTQNENKKFIVHETGHFVPRIELIKESLNWLNIYLGPVE